MGFKLYPVQETEQTVMNQAGEIWTYCLGVVVFISGQKEEIRALTLWPGINRCPSIPPIPTLLNPFKQYAYLSKTQLELRSTIILISTDHTLTVFPLLNLPLSFKISQLNIHFFKPPKFSNLKCLHNQQEGQSPQEQKHKDNQSPAAETLLLLSHCLKESIVFTLLMQPAP